MIFEKSSGSIRERWIKCFLPAAGIIAVYLLLISLGQNRDLRDLEKKRSDALQIILLLQNLKCGEAGHRRACSPELGHSTDQGSNRRRWLLE